MIQRCDRRFGQDFHHLTSSLGGGCLTHIACTRPSSKASITKYRSPRPQYPDSLKETDPFEQAVQSLRAYYPHSQALQPPASPGPLPSSSQHPCLSQASNHHQLRSSRLQRVKGALQYQTTFKLPCGARQSSLETLSCIPAKTSTHSARRLFQFCRTRRA
jgi:hypothetical protein